MTDPLPPEVTFYPNSVTVNGVARPGTNPTIGTLINTVNPSESVVVRFYRSSNSRATKWSHSKCRPHSLCTQTVILPKPPISVDETSGAKHYSVYRSVRLTKFKLLAFNRGAVLSGAVGIEDVSNIKIKDSAFDAVFGFAHIYSF
ncbi:hypothetical protein ACT7DA_04625 [Bacillus pacificus]